MLYMVWSAESNKWNDFLLLISPDNAMLMILVIFFVVKV